MTFWQIFFPVFAAFWAMCSFIILIAALMETNEHKLSVKKRVALTIFGTLIGPVMFSFLILGYTAKQPEPE